MDWKRVRLGVLTMISMIVERLLYAAAALILLCFIWLSPLLSLGAPRPMKWSDGIVVWLMLMMFTAKMAILGEDEQDKELENYYSNFMD